MLANRGRLRGPDQATGTRARRVSQLWRSILEKIGLGPQRFGALAAMDVSSARALAPGIPSIGGSGGTRDRVPSVDLSTAC